MTQHELFSSIANQALYTSVRAYSGRFGVVVHIHHEADEYPRPPKGVSTLDWVRACVEESVLRFTQLYRPRKAYDPNAGWSITRSMPYITPGEHHFTVWVPKEDS